MKVAALTKREQILVATVFGGVIQVRDRQHDSHNPEIGVRAIWAEAHGVIPWFWVAQTVQRLFKSTGSKKSAVAQAAAKRVIDHATALAPIVCAHVTNAVTDLVPIRGVTVLVFSLYGH
jgi:hypothetical protein